MCALEGNARITVLMGYSIFLSLCPPLELFRKLFLGYRKHTLIQNMPEWDCVKSTWNVPLC